ncbi:MAG: hypothetical protein KJ674_01030 [Nanoarchaeota archaeon]|nr:hypothetical protein [Nanoarchaeota archaeon]
MRDNPWLQTRLQQIWELLFPDTPQLNTVIIKFKGKSPRKFGHIKRIGKDTEIVVNSLFKNSIVPEYMIDLTIAHELTHYMHGFNSPLKQQYKHPHRGGIVTKELKNKGFSHIIKKEKLFIKKEWPKIYKFLNSNL